VVCAEAGVRRAGAHRDQSPSCSASAFSAPRLRRRPDTGRTTTHRISLGRAQQASDTLSRARQTGKVLPTLSKGEASDGWACRRRRSI
jgi:hypothetical protein